MKFKRTEGGIDIVDPIERRREQFFVSELESFEQTNLEHLPLPVDSAITITTDELAIPVTGVVHIRDEAGEVISKIDSNSVTRLPDGTYILDLSMSIKIYVEMQESIEVRSDHTYKYITLSEPGEIIIGARSYHTQAAGTVITTEKPRDVMKAISTFGSALKTRKATRSFPTLRGHPPLIKKGKKLDIPSDLTQFESTVQIQVPPDLSHIFVITSLAYYLGAEVFPGSEPRLVTTDGYSTSLTGSDGFESTVRQILKKMFFLDCVVRTEDNTPGPLQKQQAIESMVEFDITTMNSYSLVDRVKHYLEVPDSLIESYYPRWNPITKIDPDQSSIEFLPFVADNLSAITTAQGTSTLWQESEIATEVSRLKEEISDQVIQQRWTCTNESDIVTTTPITSFYNDIDRKPRDDPLDIKLICNETKMANELVEAYSTYGSRDELRFDVTTHHNLTTKELSNILAEESDFMHYIGHIDEDGFRCSDGHLNASLLDTVNTKVFFLNACHSYTQGLYLINAGSTGGIVTSGKIENSNAVESGCTIARLLDLGYPLYAAVDITRIEGTVGEQYHIVGNGYESVTQSKTVIPNFCSISKDPSDPNMKIHQYISKESNKGCLFNPDIQSEKRYHLVQKNISLSSVSKSEVIKFLSIDPIPVIVDGTLYWSDELSIKHLGWQ